MKKEEYISKIQHELDYLADQDELLVLSHNTSTATVFGIKTNQITNSVVLFKPEASFSEVYSTSQFLNNASRIYDDYKGIVTIYKAKFKEELKNQKPTTMNYNQFIEYNGKLNHKKYFVHPLRIRPKEMIHEIFAEKEDDTTVSRNNIIVQEINNQSVSSIESKNETNFLFHLKPNQSHAYFCLQVKNNGDFDTYPNLSEASVEFFLNEEGHLYKMNSIDIYRAKVGIMTLAIESKTTTEFLIGKDSSFYISGKAKKITIPNIDEMLDIYD